MIKKPRTSYALGNLQPAYGASGIPPHVIILIQSESRLSRFENVSGSARLLNGLFG